MEVGILRHEKAACSGLSSGSRHFDEMMKWLLLPEANRCASESTHRVSSILASNHSGVTSVRLDKPQGRGYRKMYLRARHGPPTRVSTPALSNQSQTDSHKTSRRSRRRPDLKRPSRLNTMPDGLATIS
ncbi:unnamed protein product [Dibothriocephalus latus]|uniref:Uncharacterized protein n=1 Tax=Dibothriocephalus latus TaxID=60516 RepID=A0A3P7MUY0_DIBLA|nr:unnamed protein product [Dibothriocephalus latus]